MAIQKFLNLSTAHITRADADALDATGRHSLIVYPTGEYGWFIHAPSEESDWLEVRDRALKAAFSNAFVALLEKARAEGCWFLRLDCDADEDPTLPVFSW